MKKKLAPRKKTPEIIPDEVIHDEAIPDEKVEEITATPRKDSFFFNEQPPPIASNQPIEESEPKIERQNKKLFILGFSVFIATIVITLFFGIVVLKLNEAQNSKKSQENVTKEEPTPEPTKAILNRGEWEFEVLNGSGVAGAAAKAAQKLEKLGYKVIKTGNYDQEITGTELYVSKDKSDDQTKQVIEDIKGDFGQLSVTGALTDSTASIRIILGKE